MEIKGRFCVNIYSLDYIRSAVPPRTLFRPSRLVRLHFARRLWLVSFIIVIGMRYSGHMPLMTWRIACCCRRFKSNCMKYLYFSNCERVCVDVSLKALNNVASNLKYLRSCSWYSIMCIYGIRVFSPLSRAHSSVNFVYRARSPFVRMLFSLLSHRLPRRYFSVCRSAHDFCFPRLLRTFFPSNIQNVWEMKRKKGFR